MHLTGSAETSPAVRRSRNRFAVRLAFLVAGFGVACWAPLVPFVRQRLAIDEATLGLVLLCLGVGSVAAMVAVGMLSTRYGSKSVMVCTGFGMAMLLPLLIVAAAPWSLDAAMNINAVEVERGDDRPLMSGFHALYSIGGFTGAGFITVLLSLDFEPLHATMLGAALMGVAMLVAWPFVLETPTMPSGSLFIAPRGIVLLIAALACAICLAEGAMRDWSALLITESGLVDQRHGGLGYMLFSVAMTAGRLVGDSLVARLGDQRTLRIGGGVAVLGIAALLLVPVPAGALGGFVLFGLGASNLVPVLFRRAGQQAVMPAAFAVSAVTTASFGGALLGPTLMGFTAKGVGLSTAFWLLAGLVALLPLGARRVTR